MKIIKYTFIILVISLLMLTPNISKASIMSSEILIADASEEGFGGGENNPGSSNPVINPNHYKPSTSGSNPDTTSIAQKAGKIMNVAFVIGVITSVISLMIIGIKYMVGSVEEKAEYKKTMIPYLIGVFFIMGITTILKVLSSIVSEMNI